MTEIFLNFIFELWRQLCMMAPALLLGFLFAGIISVFISTDYVRTHLGKKGIVSIIKASLFGVPLPLCSCGVLPVGATLKKQGASKGSVTAFMISTPQTGIDSILVTYSLLGFVFAVFRPVAAFFSGILGGILVELSDKKNDDSESIAAFPEDNCCEEKSECRENKVVKILRYAFVNLMDDIALPFIIGLFIAALISVLVPENWFTGTIGTGFFSMLVMMLMGMPLYVCATASVPIAAAFIAKGVTPGAALVFLIAGPATNAAAIAALFGILGKKSTLIYLFSIAVSALTSGVLLDSVYSISNIPAVPDSHSHCSLSIFEEISAVILLVLLLMSISRRHILPRMKSKETDAGILFFDVKGMTCSHCAATVRGALEGIAGINDISIDLSRKTVSVKIADSADPQYIAEQIKNALHEKSFDAVCKEK